MKKYISYFKIKFNSGIQYRTAAVSGMFTQFFWGGMYLLMYKAFYDSNPASIPMDYDDLSTYVWLTQGLMALVFIWFLDNDIMGSIESGNIAYELCRPLSLIKIWYLNILSARLSRVVLRMMPIFIVGFFLPFPYNFTLPESLGAFFLFLLSLFLGLNVLIGISILIYISGIYTISSKGLIMVIVVISDFLSGAVIPIFFWPEKIKFIAEILPFSAIMNVPFRIYIGNITGSDIAYFMILQAIWMLVLFVLGNYLLNRATKNIVVQGG